MLCNYFKRWLRSRGIFLLQSIIFETTFLHCFRAAIKVIIIVIVCLQRHENERFELLERWEILFWMMRLSRAIEVNRVRRGKWRSEKWCSSRSIRPKSGPKVSATVGFPCRHRACVTNAKNKICFTAPIATTIKRALRTNPSFFSI